MKSLHMLMLSVVAGLKRSSAKPEYHAVEDPDGGNLTDEIRRYDIEDLILS